MYFQSIWLNSNAWKKQPRLSEIYILIYVIQAVFLLWIKCVTSIFTEIILLKDQLMRKVKSLRSP